MTLAYSNALASVGVVALPLVGRGWIAPKLSLLLRRFFFTLTWSGIPFVIGQYCQEDEWGPIWMQYHLLDLCYTPWGTALGMCLLLIGASWLGKEMERRMLLGVSFLVTVGIGYVTEIWDTAWAWHDGAPLAKAVDVGDYVAVTVGGVITVLLYLWLFQRMTLKEPS